jgi:predicted amidohydrolase
VPEAAGCDVFAKSAFGEPMKRLRAAAVQFQHLPGDKWANLAAVGHFVDRAADEGVELIAFPECCISGYWHLRKLSRDELTALAEPVPDGPTTRAVVAMSRERRMTIGVGLIELAADGRLFNTYVVAMPDGQVRSHRKIHAFVSEHLSSGDSYTVFDSPQGWKLGVLICYDNNIIENARATALAGAEILLAPHQTGGCKSGSPAAMSAIDVSVWQNRARDPEALRREFTGVKGREWLMRWLPSRAHDNGMFLLFANGVGQDDDEVRTGNAMILDPYGRTLAESTALGDDMVIADLDASLRERATGVRWIKARRPELYGSLTAPTGKEQDTRTVRFEYGGK